MNGNINKLTLWINRRLKKCLTRKISMRSKYYRV